MKKILVTGAAGLIGHKVSELLRQQGYSVVGIDSFTNYRNMYGYELEQMRSHRSLPSIVVGCVDNQRRMDSLFAQHQINTVIHLASPPRQAVVQYAPFEAERTMILGLMTAIAAAAAAGVQHFVFVSSSMVYGDFQPGVEEDAPLAPRGLYGVFKLAGEQIVRNLCAERGMGYTIVRPSAVYGPTDLPDRVIAGWFQQAFRGGELVVRGSTEALDFTYLNDVAAGIARAALVDTPTSSVYNITRGEAVALVDVAYEIVRLVGDGTVCVVDRDSTYPVRGQLSISRARLDLGYCPQYHITQGLKEYYDWHVDTFYSARARSGTDSR